MGGLGSPLKPGLVCPHPLSPSPLRERGDDGWVRCSGYHRQGLASYGRGMDPLGRLTHAQKFALARHLRLHPTPAERHAWSFLRNRAMRGLKFRRQHVLHGFIVDFYCAAERLVLELEGNVHDTSDQCAYDAARAAFLEAAGYRVVRVRNQDVSRARLEEALRERLGTMHFVPPLPKGEGVRG